jgi:hypothetical protein
MRDDDAMTNTKLAIAMINTMLEHDDADDSNSMTMRNLLIDLNDNDAYDNPYATIMRDCINALIDDDPHTLSMLRLDFSLCPMHAIDYAICFDDDDPDCAAIRNCFPNHDT